MSSQFNADQLENIFDQAVTLHENEQYADAEKKYLEALAIDPSSDDIKYNLALVNLSLENYETVIQLINEIKTIDCAEIIEELEKVSSDLPVDLPDSIPDNCGECHYFTTTAFRKKQLGHCGFYQIDRAPDTRCKAWDLADEGALNTDELESRHNLHLNEAITIFNTHLDNHNLPKTIECAHCGSSLELSETEQQTRRYTCPKCNKTDEIGEKTRQLSEQMKEESEETLFNMIMQPGSFRAEFILAAKKEIRNRYNDVKQSDVFLALLKESMREQTIV